MPLCGFPQQVSNMSNCSGITKNDTCLYVCGRDTLTNPILMGFPPYWIKTVNTYTPSKSETKLIGGKNYLYSVVMTIKRRYRDDYLQYLARRKKILTATD